MLRSSLKARGSQGSRRTHHIRVQATRRGLGGSQLGSRSGLEWIIDRYQIKTDKASGIMNDPNDWSSEVDNPRYILNLIGKVTTVSVETVRIVESLPPLRIYPDQNMTGPFIVAR